MTNPEKFARISGYQVIETVEAEFAIRAIEHFRQTIGQDHEEIAGLTGNAA